MTLPALYAHTSTGTTWFVQAHIGNAVANGFWDATTGDLACAAVCIFAEGSHQQVVARFPISSRWAA